VQRRPDTQWNFQTTDAESEACAEMGSRESRRYVDEGKVLKALLHRIKLIKLQADATSLQLNSGKQVPVDAKQKDTHTRVEIKIWDVICQLLCLV
jgi:hypothetical protein